MSDPVRPRRARGTAWVWGAAAVIAAGAAVWFVVPPTTVGSAQPRPLNLPSVQWPSDGQSAAEVEGLGSLGTAGAQEPVPIASVTKVMTAYVVLQDHPLRDGEPGPEIIVDDQAAQESVSAEESTAPVRSGQRLTERQLLELMLIPSGNNVARLLARWDAGSQDAFVGKMNHAAAALGMTRTTYTGASGVEDSTISTASDQLLLARAAMRDEVLRAVVAEPSVRADGRTIPNTNTLLGRSGVIGLKTGSTTAAGGALMWAARGAGDRLILGVVLHQNPGNSPNAGLQAALDASQRLIEGIQKSLT